MPIGKKGLYNDKRAGPRGRPGGRMDSVRGPMNKARDFFDNTIKRPFGAFKRMTTQAAPENWKYVERKGADYLVTAGKITKKVGGKAARAARSSARMAKNVYKNVSRMGTMGKIGAVGLGVLGMAGIGFMRGAMNESRNIVYERYMQDLTYSRSMVNQSRVGLAHGTSRMLNHGGHQGLSNALSRTRHGRY